MVQTVVLVGISFKLSLLSCFSEKFLRLSWSKIHGRSWRFSLVSVFLSANSTEAEERNAEQAACAWETNDNVLDPEDYVHKFASFVLESSSLNWLFSLAAFELVAWGKSTISSPSPDSSEDHHDKSEAALAAGQTLAAACEACVSNQSTDRCNNQENGAANMWVEVHSEP